MYGFIFGFQRLVWWPKWTPASIMSRMVSGVSIDAIGFSCEAGADEVTVSVVVSMVSFRVGFRRRRHRDPKPRYFTDGTRGSLNRRVVLKRGQISTTIPPHVIQKMRIRWASKRALVLLEALPSQKPRRCITEDKCHSSNQVSR